MRRTLFVGILALGALGCSDSLTPKSPLTVRHDVVAAAADIRAQIAALVPAGGIFAAVSAQFDNIEKAMTGAKLDVARQQVGALCKFVKKQETALKLQDPDGTDGSKTIADGVKELCVSLNLYVELTADGGDLSGPNAAAVFIPNDLPEGEQYTDIVLDSRLAGIRIPEGTFGQDVTLIIYPYPEGATPLATDAERQFPFFFHYETVPAVQNFVGGRLVDVVVCTDERVANHPADRLVLGHNVTRGTETVVEPLPSVNVSAWFPGCPPIAEYGAATLPHLDREVLFSRQILAAGAQVVRYAGSRLLEAATPTSLYASNIQLAGSSGSFSPFGGYDPGIATPPTEQRLYGVESNTDALSTIALGATTAVKTLFPRSLGGGDASSFMTPVALAAQPGTGDLFAWNNSGLSSQVGALVKVNACTGLGTVVGTASGITLGAIAFAPNGKLYSIGSTLLEINATTGAVTTVGTTPTGLNVAGLAFSPDGVLYALELGNSTTSAGPRLATINLTTGAATVVRTLPTTTGIIGDMTFTATGTLLVSAFSSQLTQTPGANVIFDLDTTPNTTTGGISNVRLLSGGSAPQGLAYAPAPVCIN